VDAAVRRFGLGFFEAAHGVAFVVKQLEKCVYVAALCLELLRHGREDGFALVNRGEVERGLARAENLGDFG